MTTQSRLPQHLIDLIFDAGPRKIVFVEGEDDKETFELWFKGIDVNVLFHECGGKAKVEEWLSSLLKNGNIKEVYGIRDRDLDYPNYDDIKQCYDSDVEDVHLFILRRRNLENYLIEPQLINSHLKATYRTKSEFTEADLLKIGQPLKYITAANMAIKAYNKSIPEGEERFEFFTPKNNLNRGTKAEVIKQLAKRIDVSQEKAKEFIFPEIEKIEKAATSLDSMNELIDGKRFLQALRDSIRTAHKSNISRGELYNLLCDRIVQENAIHPDITHIIQTRILEGHEA